jgi:hypothetical protein
LLEKLQYFTWQPMLSEHVSKFRCFKQNYLKNFDYSVFINVIYSICISNFRILRMYSYEKQIVFIVYVFLIVVLKDSSTIHIREHLIFDQAFFYSIIRTM